MPLLLTVLRWSQVRTIVTIGLGWMLLPAGMAIFPAWWFVWTPIGGIAQGAFFTAVMAVVIRRASSIDDNRRMTATMQTVGYVVAATGPVVTGWVHQRVAGWDLPFGIVFAVTLVMVLAALQAVRRS